MRIKQAFQVESWRTLPQGASLSQLIIVKSIKLMLEGGFVRQVLSLTDNSDFWDLRLPSLTGNDTTRALLELHLNDEYYEVVLCEEVSERTVSIYVIEAGKGLEHTVAQLVIDPHETDLSKQIVDGHLNNFGIFSCGVNLHEIAYVLEQTLFPVLDGMKAG